LIKNFQPFGKTVRKLQG